MNKFHLPTINKIDKCNIFTLDIIIALLPATIFGCILFGFKALLVLFISVISAIVSDYLWILFIKKENSIGDLSVIVIGLLLGMSFSSILPLWIVPVANIFAIWVVKHLLGLINQNFLNPVSTTLSFLYIIFSSQMNRYPQPIFDTVSTATPLSNIDGIFSYSISAKNLFFGLYSGSIGATSSFLLILGGLYLIIKKVISPIVPACYIGIVTLLSFIWGQIIPISVFGGGLMLGAIFIATDATTSPNTRVSKIIYGVGCGLITFIIRKFTNFSEGVAYSILLMNILMHYINKSNILRFLDWFESINWINLINSIKSFVKNKLPILIKFKKK